MATPNKIETFHHKNGNFFYEYELKMKFSLFSEKKIQFKSRSESLK